MCILGIDPGCSSGWGFNADKRGYCDNTNQYANFPSYPGISQAECEQKACEAGANSYWYR